MIDKVPELLFDILTLITIVLLVVLIYFGLRSEAIISTIDTTATNEFMEDAKRNGYITKDDYEHLMNRLATTRTIYDIELKHSYTILEPEYRMRTLQEIIEAQKAAYTGSNVYTYVPITTVIPEVFDPVNTGALNTETNASVLAAAVNTGALASHVHTDACYLGHKHNSSCGVYYSRIYDEFYGLLNSLGITSGFTPPLNTFVASTPYTKDTVQFDQWETEGNWGTTDVTRYIKTLSGHVLADITYRQTGTYYVPYGERDYSITFRQYYLDINGNSAYRIWSISKYITHYKYFPGSSYTDGKNTSYETYFMLNPLWSKAEGLFNKLSGAYNTQTIFDTWLEFGVDLSMSPPGIAYNISPKTYNTASILSKVYTCGLTQDDTTDCGRIVTSITPTHTKQTVATGDPLITTVTATYLDGSTRVVEAATSFISSTIVQNQSVTLTYTYILDGVTYTKTDAITVTVVPRTKTCPNGHTYNMKSDGTDPGCPYCSAWVKNIKLVKPASIEFTIDIGTTLEENGIILLVTYLNGGTETITSGYVNNLDTNYLGTMMVTIGYKGATMQCRVTTVCRKMTCSICGYVYELWPDGTDPGCPRCISKIPVFTGNVIEYTKYEDTEGILDKVYQEGIYRFKAKDMFRISICNKSRSVYRNLLKKVFPSLPKVWISIDKSTQIWTD